MNAEPEVHNTSNPIAAATGNVTNQAVQIQNNGAPIKTIHVAANNSCNGVNGLSITPFLMGNNTSVRMIMKVSVTTANWGLQLELCSSI